MPQQIVYEFGALQPTDGVDQVEDQIWLAHQYYNQLVEIERERRLAVKTAQETIGDISQAQERFQAAAEHVKALAKQKKQAKSHDKKVAPPSKEEIAEAQETKKEAHEALKAAKKASKEALDPLYAKIDKEAHAKGIKARANCKVYWGTYLQIEQFFAQACNPPKWKPGMKPPKPWHERPAFRKWDGRGIVAVQLQGGLPVDEIFGNDSRIQIAPLPENAYDTSVPRGQRNRLQRTTLKLRVGSDGRKPIWATWPVFLHRELPEGAVVKWAKIVRTPWHQKWPYRWKLQITLQVPDPQPRRGDSRVAINLGWRLMDDGTLRIATWADSRGRTGELRLDRSFRDRIEKVKSIRSQRDTEMDVLRGVLLEAGVKCEKWKSPNRFKRFFRTESEGLEESVRTILANWVYRDNHLWWYERGCRNGALNYRKEQYRLFALKMAREYTFLVVENYDLRKIATDENRVAKPAGQRVEGAPSQAREILRSTGNREGCLVVDGNSKQATQRCHICGDESPWDAAPKITHTCAKGHTWDQDINNARNMLASADEAIKLRLSKEIELTKKREARFAKRHRKSTPVNDTAKS